MRFVQRGLIYGKYLMTHKLQGIKKYTQIQVFEKY